MVFVSIVGSDYCGMVWPPVTLCASIVCLCLYRVSVPLSCVCASVVCLCLRRVSVPLSCACASIVCLCLYRVSVPLSCVCASIVCRGEKNAGYGSIGRMKTKYKYEIAQAAGVGLQ